MSDEKTIALAKKLASEGLLNGRSTRKSASELRNQGKKKKRNVEWYKNQASASKKENDRMKNEIKVIQNQLVETINLLEECREQNKKLAGKVLAAGISRQTLKAATTRCFGKAGWEKILYYAEL